MSRLAPGVYSVSSSRTLKTKSNPNPGVVSSDAMKGSPNPCENISDSANFGTDSANQTANYTAGRTASERTEDLTERAKQTSQDLWGTAKETVVGMAENAKETIKDSAARVERSMNSQK